ncbi:FecR domain-containing protein [Sphingosinicella sp.]|uniref:FecR family protein n=1 Tax=Sphingosinicella sp. TaxID=1917971 RepID=UPI00180D31D2|nr:FecR domain-containing protein [Sphingosinicella sp.]MBA4758986.1 FecR domain-containing protein [Sphingosinicella sp.]
MPQPPKRPLSKLEREARQWTLRMLDDPARHGPAFEAWIAGDARRRAAYARMETRLGRLTTAARTLDMPRLAPAAPRRRMAAAAMLSAGLVAVAVAAWQIAAHFRAPQVTDLARENGIRVAALADRSVVTLDKGARLRVAYTEKTRHVTLIGGRARFSVSADAARPFVVLAGGGSVTARGTLFDVVSTAPCTLDVVLIEGTVDVVQPCPSRAAHRAAVRLTAGTRITYAPGTPPDAPPHMTRGADTGWAGGRRTFRGMPLAAVIAETNRYALRPIVLADAEIGRAPVVAEFDVRETERAARQLARALGLAVDVSDPDEIVLRRE